MRTLLAILLGIAGFALGCSTHVGIAATHREDISAQSRVLAIAARNLDDMARSRAVLQTAQAVGVFHYETEEFARAAARWLSDDDVNGRYERLIEAWVAVRRVAPTLQGNALLSESFHRVEHEWEKLARVCGYAGKKYEQKMEQGGK